MAYSIKSGTEIVNIKELDLDLITPSKKKMDLGAASKIVAIGKPGSGKSTLITSILYNKRHIFPCGLVMSESEDSNGFWQKKFPSTFVYTKYDEDVLERFVKRQKIARANLPNPWAVLLIDDCTDNPAMLRKPIQQALFKYGRHWNMLYILSLQYCLDVSPGIRSSIDGCFIFRESILKNRKSLYENYASIIPDFRTFCDLMDQLTDDYCAIYIHNRTTTNDWKDCVFWYKATPPPEDFKFGSKDFWNFHNARFDPSYVDSY